MVVSACWPWSIFQPTRSLPRPSGTSLRPEHGLAVEVIDQATWLAMRRLAASGLIALAEGEPRVLHQSPALTGVRAFDPQAQAAELRSAAERSLRMARVLAAARFP